jgi:hypothetical protein
MRRRLAVSCPIPPVAACPLGNSVGAIESVARRQGSSGAFDARGWACDPSPPYLHGNAHIRLPSGGCPFAPASVQDSYLVDSASSHMLVSKIKPCMSKYKQLYRETANGSLNQLSFI